MVYEIKDTSKVETLFEGMEDTLIRSCLEKVMGTVYVTDRARPKSALAVLADFAFCAGEPDRTLLTEKPEGFLIMVPQNAAWERLIAECFPDAERWTRYAIRKDTRFDRKKLEALANALPNGYALKRIDSKIYDLCLANDLFEDCVKHFGSKERYLAQGRGFAVLKDGALVSAASSYTVYREGIEIEVDTVEAERRKGLACAVSAALILDCLNGGLYPSWDAANEDSVRLAEKLGYEFDRAYACYAVS